MAGGPLRALVHRLQQSRDLAGGHGLPEMVQHRPQRRTQLLDTLAAYRGIVIGHRVDRTYQGLG